MKKLQKGALALAIILGAASFANAQMFRGGVHVTPSLPMGDFADAYDFGIGGNLTGQYFFNENIHVGLEVGYQTFSTEQEMMGVSINSSMNIIPIQLTGAYHLDAEDEFDVFVGTGVGIFLVEQSFDDPDLDDLAGGDMESLIGFSPRVGASYELSSELRLHGSVAYTFIMGNEETVTETETIGGVEFETETTTGYPDLSMLNINLGITYTLWD